MNLLQAIRKDLKNADLETLKKISKKTGVHLVSIQRVVSGYTPNPQYMTVYRLSRYRRDWKTG